MQKNIIWLLKNLYYQYHSSDKETGSYMYVIKVHIKIKSQIEN